MNAPRIAELIDRATDILREDNNAAQLNGANVMPSDRAQENERPSKARRAIPKADPVAVMREAGREVLRLRALNAELVAALKAIDRRVDELETDDHPPVDFTELRGIQETACAALAQAKE